MQRLIVGISGASGTIYGVRLLEVLRQTEVETHLVLTEAGRKVAELETGYAGAEIEALADEVYPNDDLAAAISSGSFITWPRVPSRVFRLSPTVTTTPCLPERPMWRSRSAAS